MRIVVFGAGGCVGGWVCEELFRRSDIELIACVRKWASAVRLARWGINIRRVDLEDRDTLPNLLRAADVVVNASMPPPSREPDLVAGLYAACAEAGVRRLIQFSSAAVYGNRTGTVDENTAPAPIDDYSRGKAAMERRLTEAAAGSEMRVFIFRPSIIYGPFSSAWTVRYVERILKGRWRRLGRIADGTCNLVHAQDVARAAIAAASADTPAGVFVLNINGPEVVSWNEYIERLGDAVAVAHRIEPNPFFFRSMSTVAEIVRIGGAVKWARSLYQRSAGTARAAMTSAKTLANLYPTSGEIALLGRKAYYCADRAARVLSLVPSVSLDVGVPQSVAWCRLHGVL